jgi:hypothetical protein
MIDGSGGVGAIIEVLRLLHSFILDKPDLRE